MEVYMYRIMWKILKRSLERNLEESPHISEGASYHRWRGMKITYGMMETIEKLLEPVEEKPQEENKEVPA